MRFNHEGPQHIHPWELQAGAQPLIPRPLPEIVPHMVEIVPAHDMKVRTAVPRGAVHNGFVPPEHFIPVQIFQPKPQHGNKIGKRQ